VSDFLKMDALVVYTVVVLVSLLFLFGHAPMGSTGFKENQYGFAQSQRLALSPFSYFLFLLSVSHHVLDCHFRSGRESVQTGGEGNVRRIGNILVESGKQAGSKYAYLFANPQEKRLALIWIVSIRSWKCRKKILFFAKVRTQQT
jgi:hypothetical protein